MTQKEKAQAYDEALKVANKYKDTHIMFPSIKDEMFPELKESIDERIKKVIRQVLNESTTEKDKCYSDNGVTQQEVLAWLEKRKEEEPSIADIVDEHYWEMLGDEKQGEQKPITIDIDKMVDDYANNKEHGNEEFGKPVNCMIRAYRQGLNDAIRKVGQNPVWSEEDNINFKRLLYFLDGGNLMQDHKIKLFIWVESLKERYTWKPSKEQMLALKEAEGIVGCLAIIGEQIKSLYQDLKKLMEDKG